MTNIFVYGTLKQGGSNHHFLAGQKLLGAAHTPPGFTLFLVRDYPGMVRSAGDATGVTGELWSVDDACLKHLDELEGLDEGLYERIPIKLEPPFADRPVETYLYLRSVQGCAALGREFTT